ncbi:uncharacterized protein LOC143029832 isoform X2 [Oratosquilla oratoria]|uniref:uncharacterized protein LOC143029832 isoform X2 n=1 Tax=Oratosquilla oratoria TaxID=337810 RepID=UPI003F76FC48
MVDLGGYVIILVETKDKKIKLYGSPADKADLEVGDEILEVNGKSLEDATHTEVISHIHQCIRSRTICLRVKRRTGNKLAVDLAASSNVQDAFVIAVEQQARERLERLSALKKIKPVDMTKLSSQLTDPLKSSSAVPGNAQTLVPPHTATAKQLQQGKGKLGVVSGCIGQSQDNLEEKEVNGLLENSPIYVTSVPNLTSTSATDVPRPTSPRASARSRSVTPNRTSSPGSRHGREDRKGDRSPRVLTPSPRREAPTLNLGSQSPGSVGSSPRRGGSGHRSRKSSSKLTNGHHVRGELDAEGNKSGDELELTHDLNDTLDDTEDLDPDPPEGHPVHHSRGETDSEDKLDGDGTCLSESGDSMPGTPEKNYGIDLCKNREVLLDKDISPESKGKIPLQAISSTESRDSNSSRKCGGSSGSGDGGHTTPHHKGGGSTPRRSRKHREASKDITKDSPKASPTWAPQTTEQDCNMINMVEFDPGHREMAVDVPDSFVARTKTPPRYPPPKPQGQGITPIHHNNNNSSSKSKKGSSGSSTPQNGTLPKPTPPPRSAETGLVSRSQPIGKGQEQISPQAPSTQEELERIRKYEEELKQRREREEEEAMLRSSLRSSQKLQALASHAPPLAPSGVINQAFAQEDLLEEGSESKSKVIGINELIASLQRIQNVLKSNGHRISEDMTLVAQLLTNPEFQKVLAVHNKVQETWCLNRPPTPVTDHAQQLMTECLSLLQDCRQPEAVELVDILNKYAVEGLLYAHDRIAEREPIPMGNTLPEEEVLDRVSHYPEDSVKIVRIDKTNDPLGATIRNEGDSVIIGRIVKGGAAEKSGLLHEGDEILEVNGVEVRSKSVNDICDMLAGMTGTLTFIIVPCVSQVPSTRPPLSQTMHVKAHFDYDPEEDLYIPCRELGMSFQKGDVLHIISQSDPNWWQAYRDGEEDQNLAGLVPSKTFQQQREAMRQTVVGDNNNKEKTKKGKLLCAKKHQKKKKKKMLYPNYNEDFDTEEILTYEEVALYYPRANRKRPIVLIGPPNIGRHELRQKLMEDRERFAAAIPHTSRPRRETEIDAQDYHFISRPQFESDILARKFVEHGEFERAYYGTSLNAIRAVVNSGKICVLNLHPLSLKILKSSDLKPFVVFVAPPSLEKLRQKKQKLGENVKDDELKDIIEKAREMEEQYGHYFDLIIINQDIDRAYQQLLQEINMLEREPQWVPAAWLSHDQ